MSFPASRILTQACLFSAFSNQVRKPHGYISPSCSKGVHQFIGKNARCETEVLVLCLSMFSSNNPTVFPENTTWQDRSRTHFALPLYIYIRSRCYQKAWYCQIEVDLSWRRLAFSFPEFLPIQSEPPRPSRPSLDLHPDCLSASINSEIQKSKIRRFCKFDCRRNRNIVTRPSSQWGQSSSHAVSSYPDLHDWILQTCYN